MSKKPKTTEELPSGGGSYVRQPDGALIKSEPQAIEAAAETKKEPKNGA